MVYRSVPPLLPCTTSSSTPLFIVAAGWQDRPNYGRILPCVSIHKCCGKFLLSTGTAVGKLPTVNATMHAMVPGGTGSPIFEYAAFSSISYRIQLYSSTRFFSMSIALTRTPDENSIPYSCTVLVPVYDYGFPT